MKKMKKVTLLACCLLTTAVVSAQEPEPAPLEELQGRMAALENAVQTMGKFKVSGYIQGQYQYGQKDASLKVGYSKDEEKSFNRIGIRRGRIKFTYDASPLMQGVFQLDITEKGVGFKDVYFNLMDPWIKSCVLRAGIFDRPFGFEIAYSSSRRESPERSTVIQTLFPDERDLGGMLVLQAPKTSPWNIFKLEAGLFAGNGIKLETDNRRDFIGHLTLNKNIGGDAKFGLGASYYNGSVYQSSENIYRMEGNSFVLNMAARNKGKFAKREYVGFDGQFSMISALGMSTLRAEYLFGQQPGIKLSSKSPNTSDRPVNSDTYIRRFTGGYVIFIQDIGTLPFSVVAKYDRYDPNTKVSGDEVGGNGTTKADQALNTLGLGALWRINNSLRLQAYYEFNHHEKTKNIAAVKADVMTLRLQYKF